VVAECHAVASELARYKCVAVCCRVLQGVAGDLTRLSKMGRDKVVAECHAMASELARYKCVAVCCRVLQGVAGCCRGFNAPF